VRASTDLGRVVLLIALAAVVVAIGFATSDAAQGSDALFYEAQTEELEGATAQEGRQEWFSGPEASAAAVDEDEPEDKVRVLDPDWVEYSAQFYRRRWVVPAMAAAVDPVAGDERLRVVSAAGYLLIGPLLFLLLRLRFSPRTSLLVAAACILLPPVIDFCTDRGVDSWGLALEAASMLFLALAVERDLVWVVPFGIAMAVLAFTRDNTLAPLAGIALLLWRLWRGGLPRTIWIFAGVALAYWSLIALGGRAPDSSRYIFAGTLLVFLVAADALAGRHIPALAALAALALVALAIPPNVDKLYDGRGPQLNDATTSRVEYAMLDLVRGPIPPEYAPGKDERVTDLGGSVFTPMPAGDYLEAAARFGHLGMPLAELRRQNLERREIADASLVGALGLRLRPAPPPRRPAACPSSLDGRPGHPVFFDPPPGGALLGSRSRRPVAVSLGRFASGGPGIHIGRLEPGSWAELALPADDAPDAWRVVLNGPAYVCPR